MKRILTGFWLAAGFVLVPALNSLAGNAQVLLANESLQIHPGKCSCGFGLTWWMHFSTYFTENPPSANGEIAPLPQPAAFTYWTYLLLEDPSTYASPTYAELNLPLDTDVNGNGIPDFLEVSQAVAAGSEGTYVVVWGSGYGQLILGWTRAAGSRWGMLVLRMVDPILGEMGPFTHAFELTGYSGALSYSVVSNGVAGTLALSGDGDAATTLAGTVSLTRVATNRFNLLTMASGQWTNQTDVFEFGDCELKRDAANPTVYHGTLENPGGTYHRWSFSLVDTNDANRNGIPDLSDDLAVAPPRRPLLSLSRSASELRLQVAGDIGHAHLIQQASSPNPTTWTTVQTLTLTNDPQVITLSLPGDSPAFWRVLAQ
jgi:hypothetical protein